MCTLIISHCSFCKAHKTGITDFKLKSSAIGGERQLATVWREGPGGPVAPNAAAGEEEEEEEGGEKTLGCHG